MNSNVLTALTDYFPALYPEAVLGIVACVLFLGGTWHAGRHLWGACALIGLGLAALALWASVSVLPTMECRRDQVAELKKDVDESGPGEERREALTKQVDETAVLRATVYAAPIQQTRLAILIKLMAIIGGAVLVLFSWDEMPDDQAADYHGSLLVIVAGVCLVGASNDLITLFLALELVSIPTYVLLYLPRLDVPAQEAAMKYFLLSVFTSALTLFGFSYLYGLAGTTNLPALAEALASGRGMLPGVALVALVMIVAGLGFRITAVPFHFYAPDVYQGTATGVAALLAYIPKVAGFAALLRVLGFVPPVLMPGLGSADSFRYAFSGQVLGEQVPVLFWIIAAVTMSLGNVLGLLQDNVKRMLAYSSVAHAGYMLIGLAVAPKGSAASVGGVEAVLFYLVAYGAMTIGAFAVLHYLSTPGRRVETVEDLTGLGKERPGVALLMVLFLFSLIGIPWTAGFAGKVLLFWGALDVPYSTGSAAELQQHRLYVILALIGALNAAVGAWYYLRIAAAMFLRDPIRPLERVRTWPVMVSIWVCAFLTLAIGVYPKPLLRAVQDAVPRAVEPGRTAGQPVPDQAVAAAPER